MDKTIIQFTEEHNSSFKELFKRELERIKQNKKEMLKLQENSKPLLNEIERSAQLLETEMYANQIRINREVLLGLFEGIVKREDVKITIK